MEEVFYDANDFLPNAMNSNSYKESLNEKRITLKVEEEDIEEEKIEN
jgi:hypothetical protein